MATFAQLNKLRKNEQGTDVILNCNDVRIPAHRSVLCEASPYFTIMFDGRFAESTQSDVSLHDLDADCVKLVIDSIYTNRLPITLENVQQLFVTASFLQVKNAENRCAEFVARHLDPSNCLNFKHFAEQQDSTKLLRATKEYTIAHFQEVIKTDEFLKMSHMELEEILSHDKFSILSDDMVLRNLVRWAEHIPNERITQLESLLQYIHPAYVTTEVAASLSILEKQPFSRKWIKNVAHCKENMNWQIFVLDYKHRGQQTHSYDLNFSTVNALKPLPQPILNFSLAGYRNMLYVQGGWLQGRNVCEPQDTSYYYDIYKDHWYDLNPLVRERDFHSSVVVQNQLYTVGGYTSQGVTNSVECLDLATNKSFLRKSMQVDRKSMGVVASEHVIYVMGGNNNYTTLSSAELYDTRVGRWENLPNLLLRKYFCCSVLINTNIYICDGGCWRLEIFDLRANKWEPIEFEEQNNINELFSVDGKLFGLSDTSIQWFDMQTQLWSTVYEFPEQREFGIPISLQTANNLL